MLGSAVRASAWASSHLIVAASRKAPGTLHLDITSDDDVKNFFKKNGPFDVLINCAAEANVDACEERPREAREVNALGVRRLASACRKTGAALLHVSTDYVFDGLKSEPYTEEDATGPCSIYGMTKLEGEYYALQLPEQSAVMRSTWIFGGSRMDFVNGVTERLKRGETPPVVDGQTASPSSAQDLAGAMGRIVDGFLLPARTAGRRANRVFHCANRGAATRHSMAVRIARRLGRPAELPRASARDISGWIAVRPRHTVLATERIERELGLRLRGWEEALDDHLSRTGAVRS